MARRRTEPAADGTGRGRDARLDAYFARLPAWRAEAEALRGIVLGCGLDEVVKWGQPCYVVSAGPSAGRNVVMVSCFTAYCALAFFQGALLTDADGFLVAPGRVQAGRQWRFTAVAEIARRAGTIAAYVREAVAVAGSGARVRMRTTAEMAMPEELRQALAEDAALARAFAALTPGRQRGYLYHVSSAKQAATRIARIGRCRGRIIAGKGFDE